MGEQNAKKPKQGDGDLQTIIKVVFTGIGGILLYFAVTRGVSWWFFTGWAIVGLVWILNVQGKKQDAKLRKRGIVPNKLVPAGKYLHGHWRIFKPVDKITMDFKDDHIKLREDMTYKLEGDIPYSEITQVKVEDKTTVSRRVGLKRMAVVGLFAFAMKKKVTDDLAYLVIEATHAGQEHEIFFEFTQKDAFNKASELKNRIRSHVAKA